MRSMYVSSTAYFGGGTGTTTISKVSNATAQGTCESWTRLDGTEVQRYINNSNVEVIETGTCP